MRKCRRSPSLSHWAPTISDFDPVGGYARTTRSCAYCHEQSPLGPSNDAPPEVQQEMRAAEIAAQAERLQRDGAELDALVRTTTLGERIGWNKHWNGYATYVGTQSGDIWLINSKRQWAGYLARCIATHDTRCSTEGEE